MSAHQKYPHLIYLTLLGGLVGGLCSGCDFLSSASEITFGEGSLPLVEQEMLYPSVDEFVGLDSDSAVPGLPSSLNQGTLSHLVGALSASGECGRVIDQENLGPTVKLAQFELAACTEDERCAQLCADDFLGLTAATRLDVVIMTEEQSKELQGLLSKDSADSILQVRFQIKRLDFFQGEGEERVVTTPYIDNFRMRFGVPGVESFLLLGPEDLARIRASALSVAEGTSDTGDTPRYERYELPREHPMTRALIEQILSGQEVVLSVEQRFEIERDALYELKLSPAGVSQSLQPEVVIDAIEAATSTL